MNNDDPVRRLEELAALHSKGDLTDAEFAHAKASVLYADSEPDSAPESAPIPTTVSRSIPASTAPSGLARRVRHDHSKRLWRQGWVMVVAGFLGFMYSTVGPAIVHSSALWTGRLLCDSGYHMVGNVSSYSYGSTSGTSVSYACVERSIVKGASSIEILGLQWLLGILVAYLVILLIGGIRGLARAA